MWLINKCYNPQRKILRDWKSKLVPVLIFRENGTWISFYSHSSSELSIIKPPLGDSSGNLSRSREEEVILGEGGFVIFIFTCKGSIFTCQGILNLRKEPSLSSPYC